ncbi:MAG: hypothetical protein ACXWVM_40095 [Polyangiales bacterium]
MGRRVLAAMPAIAIAVLALVATLGAPLMGCGYPDYVYAEGDATSFDDTSDVDGGGTTEGGTTEGGTEDTCTPNECGGCKTLGVKGDKCGTCGQFQCEGIDVKCVESMPAPGTTCGVCHTSKYTCSALGESNCAMIDDRTISTDVDFESKDSVVFTLDHTTELVATYASVRPLTFSDAAFVLRRIDYKCVHVAALPHPDPSCTDCMAATGGGFDCKIPTASLLTSELTVTLYTGSPDKGLTAIASGKILDASTVPTAPAFQTATFVMEAPPVTVGTQLSVGINTTSTRYAFEISGAGSSAVPPAPAKMSWWHRKILPTPSTFVEEPATDTALVVHGKACPP